ncbi:3-hydroxyacyl-CoA dehydrogenase/enoyl-CoA hydratase family protein [Ammoniphilus sp. CFH 90114]|uniref:3-hydroxyacyl-CoA dehydrogenase/enoyl-CoA hydratase family protein n=1 Tax=Ammoniphilus sp. CFH 90114 TaxID=2493665 RepID=UPI00100DA533|nr:3-hydroxyacyl-CoA dehydrogenase/enoyl-CoA hydratase family protein [Ammoniphilus sp. CFH 90114]RXT02307.1 3-hydroxyacyl-CoA dehydrogenase/enoyl-CoA hydratase family protein [Ammoniphilus sp. CFH 90114]
MEKRIRKAVVIGSGVMGAGIAAHLANVGVQVHLLDIVPQGHQSRIGLAETAKARLSKQKPSPIYSLDTLSRISPGNVEDDIHHIRDADWVIEVVVENLEIKKQLLEKIEQYWNPGTIVSTNTSGISIQRMVEERSPAFRAHFLGTHFFNPPRYMLLLEIIPTADTDPNITKYVKHFAEKKLGKGVVIARDTPNFIANRIGVFGLLITLEAMKKYNLKVSDVDSLTGPVIGRPKSATFRTLDLVGLDTFVHVAHNVFSQVTDSSEKKKFDVPESLRYMVDRQYLGDKSGQGFYLKKKIPGGKEILQWDPELQEYTPIEKRSFPCLDTAKNTKTLKEKLKVMAYGTDPGSQFVWDVLKQTLVYSAEKIPEICDSLHDLDKAMKWGFNWELGPFEVWDAIGVEKSVSKMEREGTVVPTWVKKMLEGGQKSFYNQTPHGTLYFDISGETRECMEPLEKIILDELKEKGRLIKKNSGASLIDLGDDVACLEFHSPNNAIGPDILQMIRASLEEVRKNYRGLVIGNQGKNFCVGANVMMLLMEAQDHNWFEIDQLVREFQSVAMAMKYFEKPIVSAPFSMTLGGGVEMCLPASHVQAHAETYMGLVEVGVGLIPGGAGTKEMLWRTTTRFDLDGKVDLQPYINQTFETIAMAKVSTSGVEAKDLGYLRATDGISINRDDQLYEAKQRVLAMHASGYEPPMKRTIRVVGEPGLAVMKFGIYQMKVAGFISEHDGLIAGKLAHVLSGGVLPAQSQVSEQYLLDLEREAFLSLCGEPKSQARMQHMLLKGKPLRN